MGLDLCLLVVDGKMGDGAWYSHTMIETHRCSDVYDRLKKLEEERGQPVPSVFHTFRGEPDDELLTWLAGTIRSDDLSEMERNALRDEFPACYGNTQESPYSEPLKWLREESPYGEPLKWLRAIDLSAVIDTAMRGLEYGFWAPWKPVAAYLRACRSDREVVLFWH